MDGKISKKRVVAYIAIVVVAVFAALEIAVRIAVPNEINLDSEQKYWALWMHTNIYGQHDDTDVIEFDEFQIDKQKEAGEKRVVCLGSSSTYGAGLQDRKDAFPQLLHEMIPEAQVINAGWGGYNSYQLWIYLSEVLTLLEPDVLVFYYGGNECYGHSAKTFYPRAKEIVAQMRSQGYTDYVDLQDSVAFGTSNPIALEALFL
ncbi:MAG: SGNH/GDSL hydrolase family protein, partial [Planctomycetes bacterium]|nr:SGNH/GDSL hydrolase family protein [Planctomycetota bacterium]